MEKNLGQVSMFMGNLKKIFAKKMKEFKKNMSKAIDKKMFCEITLAKQPLKQKFTHIEPHTRVCVNG